MIKTVMVLLVLCIFTVILPSHPAFAVSTDSLIDWTAVFNADGSVKDLCGGVDAVFLQDNISAGVATDMSAFIGAALLAESLVYNNTVAAAHDLGNGYVYAKIDASNNLILVAGVERLISLESTFVEFEFSQDVVCVRSGNPWPIYGARTLNDLLIRMNFASGILNSVEFKKWDGADYMSIGSAVPPMTEGCDGSLDLYAYCTGAPVLGLAPTNADIWDSNFNPVVVPNPDGFVQVSVNVGRLLNTNVDFTSIVMRTPEDINLSSFRAMGYWAR
jgi:hypothetical protein